MSEDSTSSGQAPAEGQPELNADGVPGRVAEHGGPRSLDGVSNFMGLHWEDAQTVRMQIRPELINGGGLLSGVATYAMVDYCMGSTLWVQTAEEERIATISISINYIQTATDGRGHLSHDARSAQPHRRDHEIRGAPRGREAAGDSRWDLLDPRAAGAARIDMRMKGRTARMSMPARYG